MSQPSTRSEIADLTCTTELTEAERLLIWSFRRWASGCDHRPLIRHAFARQFGASRATEALQAFHHFMDVLRIGARRVIHYHMPCCPCLGADELRVLLLVASAQHGDGWRAAVAAGGLVHRAWVEPFVEAAGVLADAFRKNAAILRLKDEFFAPIEPYSDVPETRRMLH